MKTYPRHKTHPALMGCGGKGKPMTVIDRGMVKDYVGIGWITIRKATPNDKKRYPTITES